MLSVEHTNNCLFNQQNRTLILGRLWGIPLCVSTDRILPRGLPAHVC